MKYKYLLTLLLGLIFFNSFGQNYYVSPEFDSAVNNNTRTRIGKPGNNYKSNFSDYKISASFNSKLAVISGEENVVYYYNCGENNLNSIVINLYRNVYKNSTSHNRHIDYRDLFDGVKIEKIAIKKPDNSLLDLSYNSSNTQIEALLPNPINPGDSIELYIKWETKIAKYTHLRGGLYNKNSWLIPYWYPQIAVYDDIFGWDRVQHSGNEEFYFEFANYDVKLSMSNAMCVWATGTLQNPQKIFNKKIYKKYLQALNSDNEIDIISKDDIHNVLKNTENVWHFKADSVLDFVFACSNEYMWTAKSININDKMPRTLVGAVYANPNFKQCIDITAKTLEYLSKTKPAYPYPYPHMTIFQGSGGMEFPMMVNESFDNYDDMVFVTSHEVTHSYFPFLTGMNQNKFGFMDEGLTQYTPQYFQCANSKKDNIITSANTIIEQIFGTQYEAKITTPSYQMANITTFTIASYYAPQVGYTIIEDMIGADNMTKALNQFVEDWHGKHPHPFDLFYTFERVSGQDLSFFYENWFNSVGNIDIGIENISDSTITIKNYGVKFVPIDLEIFYKDNSFDFFKYNASIWKDNDTLIIKLPSNKQVNNAQLRTKTIPDQNYENNYFNRE
ncbi:MAG: M1 family metallopeptidase [Bacteroidales bacterium]|nr:M1 family metallopeptidase [Bacteroidales bacterium]